MIPKIIHYCWFGDSALPKESETYILEWKTLNPDWQIILWNESNSPLDVPYMRKAYEDKKWANMSNFIRLYSLNTQGGVYLDTDIKLLKPLDCLLEDSCFLGFEEGEENNDVFWVNNAICGAEPNHPFIQLSYSYLLNSFDGGEMANLSSPRMTTELLKTTYGLSKYEYQTIGDVTLYPTQYFYPIHYKEAYKLHNILEYISEETIAVHMWGRSWLSVDMLIKMVDELQYEINNLHIDKKEFNSRSASLKELLTFFASCFKHNISLISEKATHNNEAIYAEINGIRELISANRESLVLLQEKDKALSIARSEENKIKQELVTKFEIIGKLKEKTFSDQLAFKNSIDDYKKEVTLLEDETEKLKKDLIEMNEQFLKKEADFEKAQKELQESHMALNVMKTEYQHFREIQEINNTELLNLLQLKVNNCKDQIAWYKATYEDRKTLGIIKDRIKRVFK